MYFECELGFFRPSKLSELMLKLIFLVCMTSERAPGLDERGITDNSQSAVLTFEHAQEARRYKYVSSLI